VTAVSARRWTAEGCYRGPLPKGGFEATVPGVALSFESQRCQFPDHGASGIAYVRGELGGGRHVDVLLHRDDAGRVAGILYHYPFDMPPHEHKGACNVLVDPKSRRRGIASALLRVAGPRFDLALVGQHLSPAGAAWLNRFVAHKRV
jgi:GNAT superfamily N-acetyltransferase